MGMFASTAERELPRGRQVFIELDEAMVAQSSTEPIDGRTTVTLSVDGDPTELERSVSDSPLGKVMLGTGDSLLKPYAKRGDKDNDLVIGNVLPSAVEILASRRSWVSTPPFTSSKELVGYVRRWTGVGLWYGEQTDEQKGDAVQYLGIGTDFDTYFNQTETVMGRLVVASSRSTADSSYRGHNEKIRNINDRRVLQVAGLLQEFFDQAKPNDG